MSDEYSNGNGTPRWVKAAYMLGVPSVIALGLVYYLVVENRRAMLELGASMNAHIGQMRQDQTDEANRDYVNRMFMRQLCWNTARSEMQVRACDDIGR